LANPNNPTVTYLPFDEVKRLRRHLAPEVLLVLDAAYAEYMGCHDYESGIVQRKSSARTKPSGAVSLGGGVQFIDQGLGGWERRERNGMGFDQPHYRLRQAKSGRPCIRSSVQPDRVNHHVENTHLFYVFMRHRRDPTVL
jgi:hypothetical protein